MDLVLASGTWPGDISGEYVLSSPEITPGLSFALFGSGRLCRLSMRPGTDGAAADRWAWRSEILATPSARLFEAVPERFTDGPTGYSSPLGFPNQANTAPLPWGERLFATWDVGRPVEVDPRTFAFLGEVGHRDSWGDPTLDLGGVLPFYLSSAHPVIDPARDCMWTVKLGLDLSNGAQSLHVVHWAGDGTSVDLWPVLDGAVFGGSHTIAQTRDFLVLADSGNFRSDPGELAGGPRTATIDDDAAVYILRKDRILATPPGEPVEATASRIAPTTGHFYARWEDSGGIAILFEHMDLMDLGYRLRAGDLDANGAPLDPALAGFHNTAMAPSTVSEVNFDPDTGAAERVAALREEWTWNLQLSAMDWSTEAMTDPTLHHVAYQGFRPGAVSQLALTNYGHRVGPLPGHDTPGVLASLRRGSLEVHSRYTYTDTSDHITSPAFVPRDPAANDPNGDDAGAIHTRSRYAGSDPGGHDGYVVMPVLSDSGMRVEIFDAARVGEGPVATLRTPDAECVPLVLHSAWMPTARAPETSLERLQFADELEGHIEGVPGELRDVVRDVAADLADG